MAASSPKGKKTLWEKEKLLVTSNFSFSHCVFKRLVPQTCKNQGLFGKGIRTHSVNVTTPILRNKFLTLFQSNLCFLSDSVDARSDCTLCAV